MKALTNSLAALLLVGGFCSEVDAQRRRGSVRYARPDGTYNRSTRGGGNVQSTQTTQGDRRTTQSTGTTRRGETVDSTREVTRDGDTLKLEGQASSSSGASREVEKEVQFDDGRIDKVERESTTTGRGGETLEREAKAEREGYGVASFEGEAKTSTGREAEVEGVAAAGAYGRRGVVADVDTKYRGDWTTVAGRGPYGAAVTPPASGLSALHVLRALVLLLRQCLLPSLLLRRRSLLLGHAAALRCRLHDGAGGRRHRRRGRRVLLLRRARLLQTDGEPGFGGLRSRARSPGCRNPEPSTRARDGHRRGHDLLFLQEHVLSASRSRRPKAICRR